MSETAPRPVVPQRVTGPVEGRTFPTVVVDEYDDLKCAAPCNNTPYDTGFDYANSEGTITDLILDDWDGIYVCLDCGTVIDIKAVPPVEITPESVAEFFTSGDNDFSEGLPGWPSLTAKGNIVHITIAPPKLAKGGAEADRDNPAHFRAVVVPVSEKAMADGPLNIIGTPGGRLLLDLSDFSSLLDLSREQAGQAISQMIAAIALSESDARDAAPTT